MPELNELIDQFEKEDEVVQNHYTGIQEAADAEISKGFIPEKRYKLKQEKKEKLAMLNQNVQNQRDK